jgi:N-acyl-D-amino-acid deacylase
MRLSCTTSRVGPSHRAPLASGLSCLVAGVLWLGAPLAWSTDKLAALSGPLSTVIVNAHVADGTGGPLRSVDVRINGDRIVKVGQFTPRHNENVIDATGLVLAPGFIDIHNHSLGSVDAGTTSALFDTADNLGGALTEDPLAATQISQGITTVILGPDGFSVWPIGKWLAERRKHPASLNVALMVGHATVRSQVMGTDYKHAASSAEVTRMAQLVEQGMQEGAIGLSSGLEYEVASYSTTDEVVAMAAATARHGGFYMTHIRDESDQSFPALEEEIAIGERAHVRVEHSHIKLGTVGVWGKALDYIRVIDAARERGVDFLADCYPYDAWNATIKVLVPDKQFADPKSVAQALADVGGAGHVTIVRFSPNPSYEQHTLEDLAHMAGVTPVAMFIDIIRQGDAAKTEADVIGQSMTEADIKAFYRQPWVMVASDGGIGLGGSHPRGAGTFPRVLGLLVREKHWLTLPEAIRKMTSLPAQRLGWKDRGTIREGAMADLVLFNPDTVIDHATFAKPTELSTGIEAVFVNGVVVWRGGKATGERPGRVLPR